MEGHGYYTSHSQAQQAYGELGIRWLEEASAEVTPPTEPLPFVIADMGAAGGGNSLAPMRRALAARQGGGAALVVHTDIASNDFSSLFELVADSPATYLGEAGVFALAEGRSFYKSPVSFRFPLARLVVHRSPLAQPRSAADPRSHLQLVC
jgi:hypothetical protein